MFKIGSFFNKDNDDVIDILVNYINIRKGRNPQNGDAFVLVSGKAYAYEYNNILYDDKVNLKINNNSVINNIDINNLKNSIIRVRGNVIDDKTGKKIMINKIIDINVKSDKLEEYRDLLTNVDIESNIFGKGIKKLDNLDTIVFNYNDCEISLKTDNCDVDDISVEELLAKAEEVYSKLDEIKDATANEMINNVWDNEDKDVSLEEFKNRIKVIYITVDTERIYIEFDDGDLFFGHHIHSYFDYDLNLLNVDI